MTTWKRTHTCGEINAALSDETVVVNGWVNRRRDLGGLIFVDLRDRWGVVQVVFSPEVFSAEEFAAAETLRSEFVVSVEGIVAQRPEGQVNPAMATGEVEIYARRLCILSQAQTPPFHLDRPLDVDETLRLKYRYLDLRRSDLQRALRIRHETVQYVRDFLNQNQFLEIETPMLTKSTPEGARDYLVPSRVHKGKFFALPQSPQMFKQLLMIGGFERYYQIVRCFRDEDLRADRQPEFTQVDLEMSFVDADDVMNLMEQMMRGLMKQILDVDVPDPFPKMDYHEAMNRFGSDRPDTRFGMELRDLTEQLAASEFKVFSSTAAKGGVIKGINAKGCGAEYSRREIDSLVEKAVGWGAKGLVWMNIADEIKSPTAKFLNSDEIDSVVQSLEGEKGDLLLLVADTFETACDVLGRMRLFLAETLNAVPQNRYDLLWVVDWPLLEWDGDSKRYAAAHHPFTAPKDEDVELLGSRPGEVRAKAYDLVLNGVELGGGSVRINNTKLQEQMFRTLGFSAAAAREQFGFFLDAFQYGTPPHAGIALGLDRMIMLLAGQASIRDVMAFPKTASAVDLMVDAPNAISKAQWDDLGLTSAAKERKR